MENYSYSSYPDSGDSSPRSREIECENAAAAINTAISWDDLPPPTSRVKLMCSYGGRIQPRPHDNQLSYVGGDTKILAVDRHVRFPSFLAKLCSLVSSDDILLKYQLPGEDLDALISVTNDEDLDHMMIEYDRLHRSAVKPVARLRLFLFAAGGSGKSLQSRSSFNDSPPTVKTDAPDYLFGLEAPDVKDPATIEVASLKSETEAVVSPPAEVQMPPVQELQRLQIGEKQQQQQVSPIQLNVGDEKLARVYNADYYSPPAQENAPPSPVHAPAPVQQQTYWQDHHRSVAPPPPARFTSIVGGDGNMYLIPATPGVYQMNAAPGQAYYSTMQRVVPMAAYDSGAAYGAAVPTQQQGKAGAYDSGVRSGQAVEVSGGYPAPAAAGGAYENGAGYAAYDTAGRAVYYAGTAATYQTVSNVAIAAESKVLKPSQVS